MTDRPWRRLWALVSIASLGLLVAGGLVIWRGGIGPSSGDGPGSVAGRGRDAPSSPTTTNPALFDRQPPVGRESTLLPTSRSSQSPTLAIPAIGVRAGIVAEGIDETPGDVGNLSAPQSADTVGWWEGGPAPGQGGVAVITGHRVGDWAFWRLPELKTGDTIQVVGTNGQKTNWKVSSIQQTPKSQLPSSVWTDRGAARLALVTCGGTFNSAIGHYNDNVLVWAKPATT